MKDDGLDALSRMLPEWLEALRAPEPPPDGLDDGAKELLEALEAPAALDLVGALVGLKQETGLQGRSVRELARQVQTLSEAPAAPTVVDPAAWARELEQARAHGREETLRDLLDVRDRLVRGLQDARRRLDAIRGIRRLFTDRAVLEAVVDGLRLSLARMDDLLASLEVLEVPVLQGEFDAASMRVIAVEARDDLPDGRVLEVLRPGYRRGSRLLRPAEVRVSRRRR